MKEHTVKDTIAPDVPLATNTHPVTTTATTTSPALAEISTEPTSAQGNGKPEIIQPVYQVAEQVAEQPDQRSGEPAERSGLLKYGRMHRASVVTFSVNPDDEEKNPMASRPVSLEEDCDEKMEGSTDLQFKKKDFRKSRAQLFQSVLSTASLKSLKQQATGNPPALQRNHSTVSQHATTNSKNFQSFIQAPVLLSVTNLRSTDTVEIGQRLPFEKSTGLEGDGVVAPVAESLHDDDDDSYREETTLQQQKLTLNALKKLSLLLAPIIRTEGDDEPRQLTLKSLNGSPEPPRPFALASERLARSETSDASDDRALRATSGDGTERDVRPRPYQPAQVDLSSFSSLTRQHKHLPSGPEQDYHTSVLQQMAMRRLGEHGRVPVHVVTNAGPPPTSAASPAPKSIASSASPLRSPPVDHVAAMLPVDSAPPVIQVGRTSPAFGLAVEHKLSAQKRNAHLDHKRLQQINGFRSPMFVPAVLRRTRDETLEYVLDPEHHEDGHNGASAVPIAATTSAGASSGQDALSVRLTDLIYSTDSVLSGAQSKTGPFTLSKKHYEYILRAAPSRKHWLKDESVVVCGIPMCRKRFNFFERRHHCRKCGGIFCKEHTSHYLYINHLAQFTTGGRGTLSRVCDNCIREYNDFMRHEFGVTSMPRREFSPPKDRTNFRKEIFKAAALEVPAGDDKVDPQAGSVPANWSWLSF